MNNYGLLFLVFASQYLVLYTSATKESGPICNPLIGTATATCFITGNVKVRLIDRLNISVFNGTFNSLTLSNNNITSLPGDFFYTVTKIINLDLSANRIFNLNNLNTSRLKIVNLDASQNDLQSLDNLPNVTTYVSLNVSSNQIKYLNSSRLFENLLFLDVSYNWLSLGSVFKSMPNLRNLDLSHNNITVIKQRCFLFLEFLQWLNISHNNIIEIESYSFLYIRQLEILNLSDNKLSDISRKTSHLFENSCLITLDLSRNHLQTIDRDVFNNIDNIRTILLEGNRGLFSQVINNIKWPSSLETLDLSSTRVTELWNCDLITPNLKNIYLHNNILNCTCRMSCFSEWINQNKFQNGKKMSWLCDGKGKSNYVFGNSSSVDLNCDSSTTYEDITVETKIEIGDEDIALSWSFKSSNSRYVNEMYGVKIVVTSEDYRHTSNFLHVLEENYVLPESKSFQTYQICMIFYKNETTVWPGNVIGQCKSVYVSSTKIAIGIIAGLVFLIPCVVILVCIMYIDRKKKNIINDEESVKHNEHLIQGTISLTEKSANSMLVVSASETEATANTEKPSKITSYVNESYIPDDTFVNQKSQTTRF